MAEDKEQDLSMEDILSSIKNILSEDEQGKEVPAATPQPEPVAETAAVSPEPEEEILELSPAMRITDDNADTGINLDAELDGRRRTAAFSRCRKILKIRKLPRCRNSLLLKLRMSRNLLRGRGHLFRPSRKCRRKANR